MKRSSWSFILASFIILLIAIGSVCAESDNGFIADSDDFNDEDDFEIDEDFDDSDDWDDDDSDDSDDDEDDWEDDDSDDDEDDWDDDDSDDDDDFDDDSDDFDDSDDGWDDDFWEDDEYYDGEFDGEFTALAASASFPYEKGMGSNEGAELNKDFQNHVGSIPQTGNPIVVLILSLLFLIAIPLRNR